MKNYDLMILGPATRDVNIDYTGEESRIVGGAVTFCTPAAVATGAKVFAAVKAAPEDTEVIAMTQTAIVITDRALRSLPNFFIFCYPLFLFWF